MTVTRWPEATTSAADVIDAMKLLPLAVEGGYWAPLYRGDEANAIAYLMTPDGFSALHRLTVTEAWTWLAGAPARMLQLDDDAHEIVLDADNPAALVPPGAWQGTQTTGNWTLVMCWCLPAFTDDCFSIGDRAPLIEQYPHHAELIRRLTR